MKIRLLLLVITVFFSLSSVAGSITCRGPHYYPTNNELEFALAAASISNESTRARILGDSRLQLNTCASELRAKLCSDAMIMALLDKSDSMKGAAAAGAVTAYRKDGNLFDKLLMGAMVGGAVGTTMASVNYARCNKRLVEEISPIADRLKGLSDHDRNNLQSFFALIDQSASGRSATIRQDEARFLKHEISRWVSSFNR